MDKIQFKKEPKEKGIDFTKIRFYKKSPYQKRRLKKEYVGWEAWVYQNTHNFRGLLITQENWEYDKNFAIESLK